MSTTNWQGARELINVQRAISRGPLYVAEHRLRNMSKWIVSMIGFGIGNPVMFLLSVGIGVGALVDSNQGSAGVDGVGYLTFLAPALLATAAIQGAMDETMFPTLEGFTWGKLFFGMNATQLSGNSIAIGVVLAAGVRCSLSVLLYELILVLFGAISLAAVPALTLTSIFSGMAFGAVMLMGASFVKQDDGVFAVVNRFIITPMFMFSGTYYPLAVLPIYLQWIGWISPMWHATEVGRFLSYGHQIELWLLLTHFSYLGFMLVAGIAIASWQFTRRLAK
jgi:lipooligosaccharide transport system permease protein